MTPKALLQLLAVLAVGGAGGAVFHAAGLPAAWLSGAMVAVGATALAGLSARVPVRLRDAVYLLLGVSLGSGISPDVVGRVGAWPASLAGLAVTVAGVTAASYVYLRRVAGWDPASAYFGSIPGALSMTMITAEASRADLRRVALSQTIRLFMLVAVLPLVVSAVEVPSTAAAVPVIEGALPLALLIAGGAVGATIGHLLKIPAGILLGAFLVSGLLHGTGIVVGILPWWIQDPAFAALGAMLGLRFAGTSPRMLAATLVAGVGAFLAALGVAVAGAFAVSALTGLGFGQTVLAFAPGGLEAMVILAFVLKADPAFVAAHHLARFVAMSTLVPLGARLVLGRGWADRDSPAAPAADLQSEDLPEPPPPSVEPR
jgi:membrane AbrB-like protein